MVDPVARERVLVLVVDDDPDIQRLIARQLREAGMEAIVADTASDGFALFGERLPDLVMLDLGLPDGSGIGLIRQIRASSDVPIIIVTGNDTEASIVACLEAGADDYITKPFRIGELLARARAALRRRTQQVLDRIVVGSLEVDVPNRRVFRHGQEVHLTPTEYRLLLQLVRYPNQVFTHRALLTAVWGPEYADEPHVLRVTLNRLRNKLGEPSLIENRPAVGYALVPDSGSE